MASAFSHVIVALTIGQAFRRQMVHWRMLLVGVVCSIVPDLDIIGFRYGIQYGDLWGHRGLTHSVVFAALLSAVLVALWYRWKPGLSAGWLFLYLFLCTASHGVLDAMTDGGLGVAFFSPFDTTRYFLGFRPIAVSPIGIAEFFGNNGWHILASEAKWIWVPSCAVFVMLRFVQRGWRRTQVAPQSHED